MDDYLYNCSKHVEHEKCYRESPSCTIHCKSIKLGENHYVHQQAANYHVDMLGNLIPFKEFIQLSSHVEYLIRDTCYILRQKK